jgi:hypothetical protein
VVIAVDIQDMIHIQMAVAGLIIQQLNIIQSVVDTILALVVLLMVHFYIVLVILMIIDDIVYMQMVAVEFIKLQNTMYPNVDIILALGAPEGVVIQFQADAIVVLVVAVVMWNTFFLTDVAGHILNVLPMIVVAPK